MSTSLASSEAGPPRRQFAQRLGGALALATSVVTLGGSCSGDGSKQAARVGAPVRAHAVSRLIAFERNVDGDTDVYTLRAGTGRVHRVTRTPRQPNGGGGAEPRWAPGGGRLVFVVRRQVREIREVEAIATVAANGVHMTRITPYKRAFLGSPAWSPDGLRIAFTSYSLEEDKSVIHVVRSRGGGERRLGAGRSSDEAPSWAPSGSRLAFSRDNDIWTMNADGREARRITRQGSQPAWSPKGREIAFSSARDRNGKTCFQECTTNREIYLARADGSRVRRLTRSPGDDFAPAWSPDGTHLAFTSTRRDIGDAQHDLYLMRRNGRCQRPLLVGRASASNPAWQPGRLSRRARRALRCGQ